MKTLAINEHLLGSVEGRVETRSTESVYSKKSTRSEE